MSGEIVIIDYGMGNLGSVQNMLKHIGQSAVISDDPGRIQTAEKLILSGVGAFDSGMANIRERGLFDLIHKKVCDDKTPVLGICLGMQLMSRRSEEGTQTGFGWIDADTVRFDFGTNPDKLKIPHMGWNLISVTKDGKVFHDLPKEPRFYFVHSYHVVCRQPTDIATTTHHGYDFVSSIERDNIFGVQFHPEKSHKFGMTVLENFCNSE